jgi:hypothetical protein
MAALSSFRTFLFFLILLARFFLLHFVSLLLCFYITFLPSSSLRFPSFLVPSFDSLPPYTNINI